jgi:hypothetical protein
LSKKRGVNAPKPKNGDGARFFGSASPFAVCHGGKRTCRQYRRSHSGVKWRLTRCSFVKSRTGEGFGSRLTDRTGHASYETMAAERARLPQACSPLSSLDYRADARRIPIHFHRKEKCRSACNSLRNVSEPNANLEVTNDGPRDSAKVVPRRVAFTIGLGAYDVRNRTLLTDPVCQLSKATFESGLGVGGWGYRRDIHLKFYIRRSESRLPTNCSQSGDTSRALNISKCHDM